MLRLSILFSALLSLGCASSAARDAQVVERRDASEMYSAVLGERTSNGKQPINVSLVAMAPHPSDLKEIGTCALKDFDRLPPKSSSKLKDAIGGLRYVRLVSPNKWPIRSPGDLVTRGRSFSGKDLAHGVMIFSTIVYDSSRQNAAFTYSFVCGGLCGDGGIAAFSKQQDGKWERVETNCSGWISQTQRGRSNNSFKPSPLRGLGRAS